MSVESRLVDAVGIFGDPVEKAQLYAAASERPRRYYTFVCESFGDDFGDDEPGCERWLVSVHLFAPVGESCLQQVRKTKHALFRAGFTWPRTIDAADQAEQHYVFECEALEPIEDGGMDDGADSG